ncbi:hypothetical protein B5X24_HaOG215459 [Helicoverpa armigera]|uniref:Uncharacterized protein n=1 Tax=Helicoverpa armigera TaxID=29058 RepID=A0A2W1B8V3_HELAM|nr:hypothetical protein B5X24_HaOG215459 [Helicoverpa armigera]
MGRQAWPEITTALNSDASGCTKTSEQWCKLRLTVSSCLRVSLLRRRLLRRSPPSQRHSEMVSVTKRFLAIEERRANAELQITQAISRQVDGQQARI